MPGPWEVRYKSKDDLPTAEQIGSGKWEITSPDGFPVSPGTPTPDGGGWEPDVPSPPGYHANTPQIGF